MVGKAVNIGIDKSLAILYDTRIVKVAEYRIEDTNVLVFDLKVRLTSIGVANVVGAFAVTVIAVLTLVASVAAVIRFG